jgi:hypothetical protein
MFTTKEHAPTNNLQRRAYAQLLMHELVYDSDHEWNNFAG